MIEKKYVIIRILCNQISIFWSAIRVLWILGDVFQVKYRGLEPKTRKEKVSRKALMSRPPRDENAPREERAPRPERRDDRRDDRK